MSGMHAGQAAANAKEDNAHLSPTASGMRRLTPGRIAAALGRRLRLVINRLRYPCASFGTGCDIRNGLTLRCGPSARINVGPRCVLDSAMTIECSGILEIGERTIFGHHCTLAARESIVIGPDCLIAEMVSIRDHDHRFDRVDVPVREQGYIAAPVIIGRNVWLAAKVTVTRGVRIGNNVIVGANAVVTKNIPDNAIAVGVPARVIRLRHNNIEKTD